MQWEKSLLVLAILFGLCYGHGFLSRPASRNNMRIVVNDNQPTECPYGANGCTVPDIDYNKQSGAAGGPGVVHATCPFGDTSCAPSHGMCGDKFDAAQDHMEGGKYSSGLVNGIYAPGQVIYLDLLITAHHKGYHEFTLYDVSDDATATTVLTRAVKSYQLKQYQPQYSHTMCEYWNIDPTTKWCMPHPSASPTRDGGYAYTTAWVLPKDVTCKRCVLQWHWVTGNSPGANPEEFWNCADISIRSTGPYINEKQKTAVTIDAGFAPNAPLSNPTMSPTAGCVAVPGRGVSDSWCQTVLCDDIYISGGYCKIVASSNVATPSTVAPSAEPSTAPSAAPATASPATALPATALPATALPATAPPATPSTAPSATVSATPPALASSRTCVAVPNKGVSDVWCQQVKCDPVYVNGGFCKYV